MPAYRFTSIFAVAIAVGALFPSPTQAQQQPHYIAISPSQPSETPGKIEVLEFFTYACGPCAAIEPMMDAWARTLPGDVHLKRVPIAFNAGMRPLQQLYFTLQALERPDLHAKAFTALHQERKRLLDKRAMGEWAAAQGVDRARFDAIFDSFSVQTQVQRANQLTATYRIESTPSFTVGGRYMTSSVMAGNSYEGAIREIDRLIPMVRD